MNDLETGTAIPESVAQLLRRTPVTADSCCADNLHSTNEPQGRAHDSAGRAP